MEASKVEKIDQKHSREYHHRMFVVCCHRRVFFTTCTRYLLCKWRQWDTTWHIAQHTKVVIYSCQSRVSASSYVHLSCIFQFQNHTKKLFPVWHPLGGCEWALKAFESALHIIELVYSVKKRWNISLERHHCGRNDLNNWQLGQRKVEKRKWNQFIWIFLILIGNYRFECLIRNKSEIAIKHQ